MIRAYINLPDGEVREIFFKESDDRWERLRQIAADIVKGDIFSFEVVPDDHRSKKSYLVIWREIAKNSYITVNDAQGHE